MPNLDTQTTREARLREHIGRDATAVGNGFEYTHPTPRYVAIESTESEVCWVHQADDLHDMAEYLDQRDDDGEDIELFDLDTDEELQVCRRVTSFVPLSGGDHIVIVP